ncbi:MAG: hypothetical protein K6A65_03600, partial [Succinivibrionaceae bacterium]|nr:hypothetical protein [Succinivibrionaceae bacterium]
PLPQPAPARHSGLPLEKGEVVGGTLSPPRFVSLGHGRKYFEGGVLPSGYVISGIGVRSLTLTSKDGETIEYEFGEN